MNRNLIIIGSALFLALTVLMICHLRFPFFNPASHGWSIGVQPLEYPLEMELFPEKVYTPAWLHHYSGEATRFLADPFIIKEKDTFYLFFEHQAEGHADIGLMTSTDGSNYEYVGEVLQEEFHLSFPQVFKHRDEHFMLPETKEAGHVLLYKAEVFPHTWKIHDTLIANVKLKDPAILLSEELNLITANDDRNFQYVFTADSLGGHWERDERFKRRQGDETRSGGNFFRHDNKWYLPFQKNHRGYGSGLALYELVVDQDELKFEEIADPFMEASTDIVWFNKGMHHFSLLPLEYGYYSVFDGDRRNDDLPAEAAWKASLKYNFYDLLRFMGI